MNLIWLITSFLIINDVYSSSCVDNDATAIAALAQQGYTITACADIASQCSNTQIASLCCATCTQDDSTCVDDNTSAIAALAAQGHTISGCSDISSQCGNDQIASLCCATCTQDDSSEHYVAFGNPSNGEMSVANDNDAYAVRCVSDSVITEWTSKCGIWYESDIWGACQQLTYDNAVQFCAQFGARLPTLSEVENSCVINTGCGYDGEQIWTSDVALGECFVQKIDATSGTVTSPFEIVDNEYVEAPEGTGNNQGGELSFDFICYEDVTNLQFRAETRSASGNDDSFWAVLDGGEAIRWNVRLSSTTGWQWGQKTSTYSVSEGFHTFTIRQREDGTQIRTLKIVDDVYPSCQIVGNDYDCPNACDFMTNGGATQLCEIADSDWHSSVDYSSDGCAAEVSTGGENCETFCETLGSHCVRAQDNTDSCTLASDHERQSTLNNGCTQEWNSQICVCAVPGTGTAYQMSDDNNDGLPDISCSSDNDCDDFLDNPAASELKAIFDNAGGARCKSSYCIPEDAKVQGETCWSNDQCFEPGMTCIPFSQGVDMRCDDPRDHNAFCLQDADCDTDYGCKGGFCSMGHNGDWCSGDSDCDSDHYCDWATLYFTCQDKVSNGNPCGWDSVCKSGDCSWFFCGGLGRRNLLEFADVRSNPSDNSVILTKQ